MAIEIRRRGIAYASKKATVPAIGTRIGTSAIFIDMHPHAPVPAPMIEPNTPELNFRFLTRRMRIL